METRFEKINISKQEYMFFLTLPAQERLDYMFGLYDSSAVTTLKAIDLSNFFSAIHSQLEEKEKDQGGQPRVGAPQQHEAHLDAQA